MSASRASERSSKKPGKGSGTESTAAAIDLTVSPAASVPSSSMSYSSSSSSSSSSASQSASSSALGTTREAQTPLRKPFVLHGSPIGGFTSLGTAPKDQVSGDVSQPSAFLVLDQGSVLSAASDSRASAVRKPGPVVKPAVAATQTEQVVLILRACMERPKRISFAWFVNTSHNIRRPSESSLVTIRCQSIRLTRSRMRYLHRDLPGRSLLYHLVSIGTLEIVNMRVG